MSLSNLPPADILFAEEIDDLLLEASNYLDGKPIASEEEATAVSSLLSRLRRVANDADDARKAEKKPHDDAGKLVQSKWKPILDKADLAADTAKQVLAPWLRQLEERQLAEAEAAQIEAERLTRIAQEAFAASAGNYQARDDAERLLKAAGAAEKHASKVGKQKAHAKGGERAVGLVDNWTPELVDSCLALKHYRATQPAALKDWLVDQARQDVRGGARSVLGFNIIHERVAR